MKILTLIACLSSIASAHPGWDPAEVSQKVATCAQAMTKNGHSPQKAKAHCVCFLDFTMSRLTPKDISILQTGHPDFLTRLLDKAWSECQHNLK